MTPYALAKASNGRITRSMAYRLRSGNFGMVSNETLEALCDVFGIADPGPLFVREESST